MTSPTKVPTMAELCERAIISGGIRRAIVWTQAMNRLTPEFVLQICEALESFDDHSAVIDNTDDRLITIEMTKDAYHQLYRALKLLNATNQP